MVTAGAQGIGKAVTKGLIDEGSNVAIHYFSSSESAKELKEYAESKGCKATTIQAEYFESDNQQQLKLKKSIEPKKSQSVYVGILYESQVMNGITRTQLFVKDHDEDAPFYPVTSSRSYIFSENLLQLEFGISVDPPNHYYTLTCGEIRIQ